MKKWIQIKKMTIIMVKDFLKENWKMSDKILILANCFLFGILLGALWSPKRKKNTVIASYNSENSASEKQEEA